MVNKKDIIKSKILDFQNRLPIDLVQRETQLPGFSDKIITVTGVRRCGKTYMLFHHINMLLRNGINKEQILFFSFDDERVQFIPEELDLILQAYKELFPDLPPESVFYFFDEIQFVKRWEQFVRRVYDSESRHIYISGSNAKFLVSEISTSLRGRTIQKEVFPLSFAEFCDFKNIDRNDLFSSAGKARLLNAFNLYLKTGGFPEIARPPQADSLEILHEYYYVLLFRDIVERYNVHNIPVLKYFIARLVSNLTKPTSVNKIYNEIRSAGIKTDKNLLYKLADQLESVYFTFRLKRYEPSVLKSELIFDNKTYLIDNGLINILTYNYMDEPGKLLENNLFLWLRRQRPFQRGLHYYKGRAECDFVLFDRDKPLKLIQASASVSESNTLKREIKGLTGAARYFNCDELMIVTIDEETEIKHSDMVIRVIPAWKLYLQNKPA